MCNKIQNYTSTCPQAPGTPATYSTPVPQATCTLKQSWEHGSPEEGGGTRLRERSPLSYSVTYVHVMSLFHSCMLTCYPSVPPAQIGGGTQHFSEFPQKNPLPQKLQEVRQPLLNTLKERQRRGFMLPSYSKQLKKNSFHCLFMFYTVPSQHHPPP